jgi:hypothetical protein
MALSFGIFTLPPLSSAPQHKRKSFTLFAIISFSLFFCPALTGCSALAITIGNAKAQAPTAVGATRTAGPIAFPPNFMTSIKSYGAVGDGVTDDTSAIQSALNDGRSNASANYYGLPKALYFPPGTYLVRKTLQWNGCCVTLQGAGSTSSIIRLAPGSEGFNNPASPQPLILTPLGNQSFHQNIWDMGITVGAGNAGAIALSYVSNNSGAVRDVLITSEDGKGHAAVDLTRQYAGPLLLEDLEIHGFDVGVDLANAEYGATFEGITLTNQNIAGIRNVNQAISVRNLVSNNSVPVIANSGGLVVLLDAILNGGSTAYSAIQTNSTFYLRSIASSGYQATLLNTSNSSVPSFVTGTISEYIVGTPQALAGEISSGSLKLAIEETPSYVNSDLSTWAAFTPRWYGDTAGLQSVLNSGKSTIYFPFGPNVTAGDPAGSYFSYAESDVTVPDTVERIVGFSSIVTGSTSGPGDGGIRLIVTSNSTTPLVIEEFGYGLKIDHRGNRPIVIKHSAATYVSSPGAGNLYLEDVELGSFVIQPNQHVWARQLNLETAGTKLTNQSGVVWILGLKTEQPGTVILTEAGGQTELLGGLIYPATTVPSTEPAFRSTNAQASYIYTEPVYCSSCGYAIQVQETYQGVQRQIGSSSNSSYRMPLFVGPQ